MKTNSRWLAKRIRDLSSEDPSIRRRAVENLAACDERALYPLIKALGDRSPGVQDAAMRAIMAIGGEVSAYMVLPLLREEPYLRNTAMLIIRELGTVSVPLLYSLLRDRDDDVRKFGLDLLIEIRDGVDAEKVLPLFQDSNQNVRASAAKTAGVLMGAEAVPYLIEALRDGEWVCFSALEALARIGDASAIDAIAEVLESPFDTLRFAAIETLGHIGSHRAAEPLVRHLEKAGDFERRTAIKNLAKIGVTPDAPGIRECLLEIYRDGDWDERLVALRGLAEVGADEAVGEIIDIAGSLDPSEPDSEDLLAAVKETLVRFGCGKRLLSILEDPDFRYRGKVIAIEMIGEMKCTQAVPVLVKLVEGKVRDVRRASIMALAGMEGHDSQAVIMGAASDHDSHVRRAAIAALGRIGGRECAGTLLSVLETERYPDILEETVKAVLSVEPEALFVRLDRFGPAVRAAVASLCGDADVLLALSRDGDVAVRKAAVAGLGRTRDVRLVERLKEAIRDAEPEVRKAAVNAMTGLKRCRPEIETALADPDMWVRVYAVRALGEFSDDDAVASLAGMAADAEVAVVLSAIESLRRIGSRSATEAIVGLLDHSDPAVSAKAEEALSQL